MSIDIKLDALTHDLSFSKTKDLVLIDGAARIAQQVKVTLWTFFGEWFLDETFGVPYLEFILVKNPNRSLIENILRQKVMDVPGIKGVPTINIEYDAAQRTAAFDLPDMETDEGLVSVKTITPSQ
jgi:hypothetical protein